MNATLDLEVVPHPAVACDAGQPAVKKFIASFRPIGLYHVISDVRKAEGAGGRAQLRAELDALEAQLKAIPADDYRRFAAIERRDRAWIRVEREAGVAEDAGRRVWFAPASIKAIRDDLRRLGKACEKEMSRIVEIQVKFFSDNDLVANEDIVKANSPTFQAHKDFFERHLLPALAEFEYRVDCPEGSPVRDVTQVSWILCGSAWRQIELP